MSLRRDLEELSRLDAREWADLAVCWMVVPAIGLGLWACGLQAMRRRLATSTRPTTLVDEATIRRLSQMPRWISIAARRSPWRAKCLTRSLALQWILRRHGMESDLRLGVRREGAVVLAHAWIDCAALPGLDPAAQASGYAAFPDLEAGGTR